VNLLQTPQTPVGGSSSNLVKVRHGLGITGLSEEQVGLKPVWKPNFFVVSRGVGSNLKCPLFVASEMSGFRVVPSPIGLGWFWGWGCRGRGLFPFPCLAL
jgi:hypothetical protein